ISTDYHGAVSLFGNTYMYDMSVFDVLFSGNNITDGSSGVYLRYSMAANLIFENNNITGTDYGVFIFKSGGDSNYANITFANNNIRATSGDGVYMSVSGSNNSNITFANNNITGSSRGVYLSTSVSNNSNITFANNNITSRSYCVYLPISNINYANITFANNNIISIASESALNSFYLDASSNTCNYINITFANNKITGKSGYGFHLDLRYSHYINVTVANNNITDTVIERGVYLVYGSIFNVTVANNNITGTAHGVYLYSSSNNSNITLVNNNIRATFGRGVDLEAYTTNNTNITFANNNITCDNYGVYVSFSSGSFKDFNFLNNTINATYGDGFYFYGGNNVSVTDLIIRGNNIIAHGAGLNFTDFYPDAHVNATVEYNRIIAPVGVNFTNINDNSSFNFNWWGVNNITGK
ncbi:right-handed parallel beta-helix repeat-containing protein, partial [Methanobrevibacter arboriphilus]